EMGQEQLVQQLDISKPGVSRALSTLEMKGLVIRQPDPDDGRARRVRLTDKAHDIGPQVEQVYNEVYALAMEGISQEELESFLRLFGRMSENFTREQAENK
ncbi:MAG: MarR family winged helix-turn-helix transcriptional regulator, partial [Chloroflexota bacterium]